MSKIGYARVSTTGQSLDVQLSKLNAADCDKIFQEKRSGKTASRPELQKCMQYLRANDTLVITRLDRLARSVSHLSKIAERLESEGINLVVIDQSIDTTTATGRLMFNMLSSIAEFETDLREERQKEGIEKAKDRGVKFGRKAKRTTEIDEKVRQLRANGQSIGSLSNDFRLGIATIYRIIAEGKQNLGED